MWRPDEPIYEHWPNDMYIWQTDRNRQAFYNTGRDKRQQKAMKAVFETRASQSEPAKLAVMQYFRRGSPMFGTHAEGGPVLGWEDCPVVCTAGEEVFRFYDKAKIEDDVDVTWLTPEVMAILDARYEEVKAARDPADTSPIMINVPAVNPKFKCYY